MEKLLKEKACNFAGDGFSLREHWEILECTGDFIDEITPVVFRAPTVPEGETKKGATHKSLIEWYSLALLKFQRSQELEKL